MNEQHSTYQMVKGLHERFDHFEHRIDQVEDRVVSLEKSHAADIAHLEKHESEACLKESAILHRLEHMSKKQDEQHDAFVAHADREDDDRRWIRNVLTLTLLGVIGTLGTVLLSHVIGSAA
jgi:phage shock protein A